MASFDDAHNQGDIFQKTFTDKASYTYLTAFNLPGLSLIWGEHFEKLRKEINNRKEIVSRIKFAVKSFERDRLSVAETGRIIEPLAGLSISLNSLGS